MVDREARDELVGIIEDFLAERAEYDDAWVAMERVGARTKDGVAKLAPAEFFTCELLPLDETWDRCQRLLLALRSDADVRYERRWELEQGVKAAAFVAVCIAAATFLRGQWYLLWLITGCLTAGLMFGWPGRTGKDRNHWDARALDPFGSASEMLRVLRVVPGFKKERCPAPWREHAEHYRGRSDWWISLVGVPVVMLYSPLLLPMMCLPGTSQRFEVPGEGLS